MKRISLKTLLLLILLYGATGQGNAINSLTLSDDARISLLTCTPGTEVYSKYGHSAVRVEDPAQEIDWTFNYGVFNFNTDHFYLRFIKGDTWYQLDVEPTTYFIKSNNWIGRKTYYQVLNLTQEEKQAVLDALLKNYEPKNRYYLYNFVFDNCATRPYHILRQVLSTGYAETDTLFRTPKFEQRHDTYRQLISHYSEPNSWTGFGIDLIFGMPADQLATTEARLFLPEQLMDYTGEATLPDGRKLCAEQQTKPFDIALHLWWRSPYMAVLLLALLLVGITVWDFCRSKKHPSQQTKWSWWFDITLLFGGGVLGCIMFFLSFFSIHPLVQHNLNLLLINPLLLFLAIALCFPAARRWLTKYIGWIGLAWLLLCIVRITVGEMLQSFHLLLLLPALHGLRWALLGDTHIQKKQK